MLVMSILTLTSCIHSDNKEQQDIQRKSRICTELITQYRAEFKKSKYPKLDKFSQGGYDWYWTKSCFESSGFITEAERKRILEKHGEDSLQLWEQGWKAALDINTRAIKESEL